MLCVAFVFVTCLSLQVLLRQSVPSAVQYPKARYNLVIDPGHGGMDVGTVAADGTASTLEGLLASQLAVGTPELRSFANLFEIVSQRYWRTNHGARTPDGVHARAQAYVAEPEGRAQVEALLAARVSAAGTQLPASGSPTWWQDVDDLFAGSHDVVVARRHLVDGAQLAGDLAGAGTLDVAEHRRFVAFTVEAP